MNLARGAATSWREGAAESLQWAVASVALAFVRSVCTVLNSLNRMALCSASSLFELLNCSRRVSFAFLFSSRTLRRFASQSVCQHRISKANWMCVARRCAVHRGDMGCFCAWMP
eukprot:2468030-Rhodomonas_salina.1